MICWDDGGAVTTLTLTTTTVADSTGSNNTHSYIHSLIDTDTDRRGTVAAVEEKRKQTHNKRRAVLWAAYGEWTKNETK